MDPASVFAPVQCVIREKDPRLDVKIVRKGRSIVYKVEPRNTLEVRQEIKAWKCPANDVRTLVTDALDAVSSKLKCYFYTRKKSCLFLICASKHKKLGLIGQPNQYMLTRTLNALYLNKLNLKALRLTEKACSKSTILDET